jgi:hypothetical protein
MVGVQAKELQCSHVLQKPCNARCSELTQKVKAK